MPEPKPFIVGRSSEMGHFARFVAGECRYWLLNFYGPGGIGKTVVCEKFVAHAKNHNLPLCVVRGDDQELTPERILHAMVDGLIGSADGETFDESLSEFKRQRDEYLIVQKVLQRSGGVQAIFDNVGKVKDPFGLTQIIGGVGQAVTKEVELKLANRAALERYLRGADRALTTSLVEGMKEGSASARKPVVLIIDTYEAMEGVDHWVCRTLARALPLGTKVVIFGRNELTRVNFDWNEYGHELRPMELPELTEYEANMYLTHHGLPNALFKGVYGLTGGYPLLLMLTVKLSQLAGGWNRVELSESAADRDFLAKHLLERILREERVGEIRDFLEKGVVADWFNPEIVSVVLQVGLQEGRVIYDKLQHHSFVERHPNGLKFHDKISELLRARLRFTSKSLYDEIEIRLLNYHKTKTEDYEASRDTRSLTPELG